MLLLACGLLFAHSLGGKDKKKKTAQTGPFAVIAGTVFRSDGFSLAGAEVTVTAVPAAGGPAEKLLRTVANGRGEFAVHVPIDPMKYHVDVKLPGFAAQQKDVEIEGEQRKEINFLLDAIK